MLVVDSVNQLREIIPPELLRNYTDSELETILGYWERRRTTIPFTFGSITEWKVYDSPAEAAKHLIGDVPPGITPEQMLYEEGYLLLYTPEKRLLVRI